MGSEIERRLKCLSLYVDTPPGLEAATARAREAAAPLEALIDLDRVCLAVQIGAVRRDRAIAGAEDLAALAPRALLRGMLERLAGPLPERLRAVLVRRIYAAMPEALAWNLGAFDVVALSPPPAAARDQETARLHRALSSALGAGVLAPRRVAERSQVLRMGERYGALIRWIERTGAPLLECDREMREMETTTPRIMRRRHEDMVRLLATDLRLD